MQPHAKIYLRRNGAFGSSCDSCQDTGHVIHEDSGFFTVFSADDPDVMIAQDVSRDVAEAAIAADWRA